MKILDKQNLDMAIDGSIPLVTGLLSSYLFLFLFFPVSSVVSLCIWLFTVFHFTYWFILSNIYHVLCLWFASLKSFTCFYFQLLVMAYLIE